MSRTVIAIVALLLATAAQAQNAAPQPVAVEPPPSVTVMVPVVGRVWGMAGVQWRTDVELINDMSAPASVFLSLPTAPDQPFINFDIPPHGEQRFTDVIGQAFGMDGALSPLMVQTLGRQSVRVVASVYSVQGDTISQPEPIAVAYRDVFFPLRALYGLSFNDAYRTNIGFANLNDAPVLFTIALQHVEGRNIAVNQLTVPANSLWHTSIQTLFPLITKGDDFTVLVETGAHDTYVYGSVISNTDNRAQFIEPTIAIPGVTGTQ